jgi:hypothetical protein
MMDKIHHAHQLAKLTALEFNVAQAKFSDISRREGDLRQNLAQLLQHKRAISSDTTNLQTTAFDEGANVRWQQWVDQRRAVINTELAQVLALKENCRANLARAYGRDQAAQAVIKRLTRARKKYVLRKLNYES